jgi:DNA-binding IclR family transcriptional regulator
MTASPSLAAAPRRGRPAGNHPASGLKSLEAAVAVLRTLAEVPGPMGLTALAQATGQGTSACHRYLATFAGLGLVRQAADGRYTLGPTTLALGLAALQRLDPVALASDALPGLAERAGHTVLLSVWSPAGPTIIRWQSGGPPFATALGLGSVLPITRSATGLAFIAHMPDAAWRDMAGEAPPDAAMLDTVRACRLAQVAGTVIPGLKAIAAPVLDHQGQAALALTLIGSDSALDRPDGPAGRVLDQAARDLTAAIGGPA